MMWAAKRALTGGCEVGGAKRTKLGDSDAFVVADGRKKVACGLSEHGFANAGWAM